MPEGDDTDMKFLVVFVHKEDVEAAAEVLRDKGFRFTRLGSTGGFLQEESTTFMMGVSAERLDECLDIFRRKCKSRRVGAPGSVLAGQVVDEEKYKRYSDKNRPVTVEVGGAVGFLIRGERVL